ncbi:hypothetical protein [Photorhabdus caribbeanensis]|uniref:hypothetical protein n=1 Tax=Photorhabdus caribbeanensis TaxID=1004165 RepID=UPI001BD61832|nr:hypothetical protein [Photorhabdus caribbeanensis]
MSINVLNMTENQPFLATLYFLNLALMNAPALSHTDKTYSILGQDFTLFIIYPDITSLLK